MHPVLSRPAPFARPSKRQPEARTDALDRVTADQTVQLLGGGIALAYGLRRGTWSGLALAAVGGFLVFRGLTGRRTSVAPWQDLPRRDFLNALAEPEVARIRPSILREAEGLWGGERGLKQETVDWKMIPSVEVEGLADSPRPVGVLTQEEHAKAQVRAYFNALKRGGGWLPPYDEGQAVEDFCRAAGDVLAQRAEDRANLPLAR